MFVQEMADIDSSLNKGSHGGSRGAQGCVTTPLGIYYKGPGHCCILQILGQQAGVHSGSHRLHGHVCLCLLPAPAALVHLP